MLNEKKLEEWIKDVTGWAHARLVDKEFHYYGTTVVSATYKVENMVGDCEVINLTPNKEDKIVTAVRELPGGTTPDWSDERVVKTFELEWDSPFDIL